MFDVVTVSKMREYFITSLNTLKGAEKVTHGKVFFANSWCLEMCRKTLSFTGLIFFSVETKNKTATISHLGFGNKTKELSHWGREMKKSFPLFNSPKPLGQFRIVIIISELACLKLLSSLWLHWFVFSWYIWLRRNFNLKLCSGSDLNKCCCGQLYA